MGSKERMNEPKIKRRDIVNEIENEREDFTKSIKTKLVG